MQSKPIKKIFVCEFITGGGFSHRDLPDELVEQGLLMRDALLRELSYFPYQVVTTVDARLAPVDCDRCLKIEADDDIWQVWEDVFHAVDAVWLIAPETDGYLEKMTALASKHKKLIIGSGLASVAISSSKLATYQRLKEAGIATLETFKFSDWHKSSNSKWLAKPDDGAGCEDTVCFAVADELQQWMLQASRAETHVIQPYLEGKAASISSVMHAGKAHVLSCNKQLIEIENNVLTYQGCIVNEMSLYWNEFEVMANKIAQLLPDLAGYVGIDVIVTDSGAQRLTIVEINPRLTTSFAALREATGHNPAELIINTLTQKNYAFPLVEKNKVRLELGQNDA